jgi:uroporphyrinogen-III synthase
MSLKDKVLAITRNERDAQEFAELVAAQGGRALALPTIEIVPKGKEAAEEFLDGLYSGKHDYCAFMSSQAVNVLFQLADAGSIVRALKSTVVIAVGPKTRQSLEERGVPVKLVPDRFSSEGLVELLSRENPSGKKIIIPRSGAANEFAAKALTGLGMQVDEVLLYTVKAAKPDGAWEVFSRLLPQRKVAAVVFTSASSVEAFFEIAGDLRLAGVTKVVSIGPFTSRELQARNVPFREAKEHTVKGAFDLARELVGNSF